ncbi:MAG: ADP-ribosylglycohydrolase family protein [Acidimicrobiia bacterium]
MDGARSATPPLVDVLNAYSGALLGVAVGDALGAPLEGRPGPLPLDELTQVEESYALLPHTDDTVMTIDVAGSLLFCGGLDEDHLARTFAASFARDPHRGYGRGTASLLTRIAAGDDWRTAAAEQFGGRGSLGDGAAMRVTPVALFTAGDPAMAAELARRSARVTHTHPLAVDGAAAQAAATAVLLDTPSHEAVAADDLAGLLHTVVATDEHHTALERVVEVCRDAPAAEVVDALGNGVTAVEAVPAALCTFLRHQGSFEDTVRFAIGLGGDTDTIAAMAGALAGAHLGRGAIPTAWLQHLEGRAHLDEIAHRFARRRIALR